MQVFDRTQSNEEELVMRPRLPDFAFEAKQRLIRLLKEEGPCTTGEAVAVLFSTERVPESLAPSLLEVIVRADRRFEQDPDGLWHYREPENPESLRDHDFVVLDVETTGGQPPADRITELGAVRLRGGEVVDEFCTLVNPEREIPLDIVRLTGITNEMVADQPTALEVLPRFAEWLGEATIVAHNAAFDRRFVDAHWEDIFGEPTTNTWICSVRLARKLYPELRSRSLGPLCRALGIPVAALHRAGNDARATALVFLRELDDLASKGITDWEGLTTLVRPVSRRRQSASRRLRYGPPPDEA